MLVDLDVDAALAFLIVKVTCPGRDDRERTDHDEKDIPIHRPMPRLFLRLTDAARLREPGARAEAVARVPRRILP